MCRESKVVVVCQIVLEEAFDAVEVFQNKLVASVQLDSWFSVDTLGVEFCA